MTKRLLTFMIIIVALLGSFNPLIAKADSSPVLITEVQTGFIDSKGVESPKQEFIELTNVSSGAVNVTGWKLEYLSAASTGTGAATQAIDTLNGQISSDGHAIWEHEGYTPITPDIVFAVGDTSTSGYLAKSGGHIRLMNGTNMVDCVAWGSATAITGCDKVSTVAAAGYTIQRPLVSGTYNKADGVVNLAPATPQGGNLYSLIVTPPMTAPPATAPTTAEPNCDNVQLSEILANPAGDDTAGEFVELYNPTEQTQSLYGCTIKLSSGKQYAFLPTDILDSHSYKAFPYSTTGLQLGNSGGGVTLTMLSTTITTTYPAVGDDEAWAFVDGIWYLTKVPTPGAVNLLTQVAADVTGDNTTTITGQLDDCPAGKYRNPLTGRCKNFEQPALTAACSARQERNPLTGRCRNIVISPTSAVCSSGQEKNPATNRCRKVVAAPVAKTCPTGQERNADTNRCRKIVASTSNKFTGEKPTKKIYNYLVVGTVLAAVVGYGLYEYRHDVRNRWARFKLRLGWKALPESQ